MTEQPNTVSVFDRIDLREIGERVTDLQGNYLGIITSGTSQYGLWMVEAEDGSESLHEGPQLIGACE
jgi:hypothetical protein